MMQAHSYRTIQKSATGLYKEKGSKFLAFVYPVVSEAEVKEYLEALRKEYFDARHHCYAWMLGPDKKHFRAVDDGEPNHSAGDPILGQIRSHDLTDILIVVVRYFGGIKLGVGGLITAYKAATEDALHNVSVVVREVTETMQIEYSYSATPEIMRMVKEFDLTILSQQFEECCTLTFAVSLKAKDDVLDRIKLLHVTGTQVVLCRED